eukprot:gene2017-1469_t
MPTPTFKEFRSALENANYKVSQFHHDPTAVKTDAPSVFVWDIIRTMYKKYGQYPVELPREETVDASTNESEDAAALETAADKTSRKRPDKGHTNDGKKKKKGLGPVAYNILRQEIKSDVDLTLREQQPRERPVARFAPNPEENWGPKRRAGRPAAAVTEQETGDEGAAEDNIPAEKKARHV